MSVIGGKEVNWDRLPPIYRIPIKQWPTHWPLGDLADLEALGVRFSDDPSVRRLVSESIAIVYHLGRKVNRTLTLNDVRSLTTAELGEVLNELFPAAAAEEEEEGDLAERGAAEEGPLPSASER